MEIKTIIQGNLTEECWSVQMFGTQKCMSCKLRGKRKCGGKEIVSTGKNSKGIKIGWEGFE
jgi:hypothetical protein